MAFCRSAFSAAASCAAALLELAFLEGGAAGAEDEDSWASAGKDRSSVRKNAMRLARAGRVGSTAALYPVAGTLAENRGWPLAGFGLAQEPLCTLMPPETVCTSTRPVELPTWARMACLLCSSIMTGRLVRISPEVASAESRKEELGGTRISTEPETVFRSQ